MSPIGGSNIGWDPTSPADTESAGLGDDRIRSLKSSIQEAMNNEHNFPSTGGAGTGYHLLGSARPYVDVQSMVSSTGTDGRLLHASDTSRLFGVGSGGTSFIGGPTVLSAGSFPGTTPQRHYWVTEFGQDVTNGTSGVVTVTIPNSGYSGIPFIWVTDTNTPPVGTNRTITVYNMTATAFGVATRNVASGASTSAFFNWLSIGSRVF